VLAAPRATLELLRSRERTGLIALPWGSWVLLTALAFAGTAAFGIRQGLSAEGSWTEAARLVFSAGGAWAMLIPALCLAARLGLPVVFHASLVTMACGEAALVAGALLPGFPAWAWVVLSNVTMAAVLCALLAPLRVPWKKTLALWIVVLDGTGALLYFVLWPGGMR
jgi:hypothetical protein